MCGSRSRDGDLDRPGKRAAGATVLRPLPSAGGGPHGAAGDCRCTVAVPAGVVDDLPGLGTQERP